MAEGCNAKVFDGAVLGYEKENANSGNVANNRERRWSGRSARNDRIHETTKHDAMS